jgi:hypothetical protein
VLVTAPNLVTQLTRELNALPEQHGGVVCPSDDGSQIIVMLGYTSDRTATVSVGLEGCETATNGTIDRTASGFGSPPEPVPPLIAELKRLLAAGS